VLISFRYGVDILFAIVLYTLAKRVDGIILSLFKKSSQHYRWLQFSMLLAITSSIFLSSQYRVKLDDIISLELRHISIGQEWR